MRRAAGSARRAETGACAEGTRFGGGASVRRGGARSLGEDVRIYLHHSGLSPGSPVLFYPSGRVPSTPPPQPDPGLNFRLSRAGRPCFGTGWVTAGAVGSVEKKPEALEPQTDF